MRSPLRTRNAVITIDRALDDQALLGAALGDRASWATWKVVLKAAFGLELNRDEARIFAMVAGSRKPPAQRVRELWAVCGRRGGKSRIAAALAVYVACFVKHLLSPGEIPMVLVLAASRDQAQIVHRYVRAFLEASPILRREIKSATRDEIELRNGVVIATHANSFRTIRGRTLIGAILDEVAYWRSEESANPDVETYTAVLPSLLTTKGVLIGISSGYRRVGLLHAKHRDHFGQNSADILVVQGGTLQFNTTLTEADIEAQRQADPAAANAEWDGGFRDDLASFLDDQLIDAAIEHGRPLELPPMPHPAFYRAFCDAAGGTGRDSYTLSIGHREGERYAIDLVRGTRHGQKYDPQQVTAEYAKLLRDYRVTSICGDKYGSEWVAGAWQKEGIRYISGERSKSEIYLSVLPLWTRGLVGLPNHPRLLRELRLLERQTHRGGRDSVDHPRGGHDDFANSCCGVLRSLADWTGFKGNDWSWVTGEAEIESDEQRRARLRRESDDWRAARLQSYVRSFGWPMN